MSDKNLTSKQKHDAFCEESLKIEHILRGSNVNIAANDIIDFFYLETLLR